MNETPKRARRGFTLTETLVAVLILTLLTGAISVGISTAVKAKSQLLFTSESDLLASTLHIALGDVLHYATDPATDAGGAVSFTNLNYGVVQGHLLESEGKLYLSTAADAAATRLTLVSDGAYTGLKISAFSLTYADGLFTGQYTITGGDAALTKTVPFVFQPLNGAPAK